MLKSKTTLTLLIALIVFAAAGYVFRSNLAEAGRIVFKRNVIVRAFYKPTLNGSLATSTAFHAQSTGGVDDYNNNQTRPADAYATAWTTCAAGNNYCNTGTSTADMKDNSTGLIWSKWLGSGTTTTWFWANNCAYPNGLPGDDGTCNTNTEAACECVKLTSSKTGCDALTGWRLPHQKELMQAYIDGSWGNLSSANYSYWLATTQSNSTQYAWYVALFYGSTTYNFKTNSGSYRVRCVR